MGNLRRFEKKERTRDKIGKLINENYNFKSDDMLADEKESKFISTQRFYSSKGEIVITTNMRKYKMIIYYFKP